MVYYGNSTYYNSDICHYGVKGMKWGVRRYQNSDWSLTSAGKKRISNDQKHLNKVTSAADYKKTKASSFKKSVKDAEAGAREALTPSQYGRWYSSGAHQAALRRSKVLDKSASKASRKADQMMRKAQRTYEVAFNTATKAYSLSQKKQKKVTEKASKTTMKDAIKKHQSVLENSASTLFKKHPDLYDDFGGPDQIDDWDLFDMVLSERGYDQ